MRAKWTVVPVLASMLVLSAIGSVTAAPRDLWVDRYGDALDFSNPEDVLIARSPVTSGIANASVSGGQLHFDLTGAGWSTLLWPGLPGSLHWGREGAARPLDTSGYGRLVIRMNTSTPQPVAALWFSCVAQDASCQGGAFFTTQAGWQTYEVPLQPTPGDPALAMPWGAGIVGLRLLFPKGSGHVDVDWARVAPADGSPVSELADRSAPKSYDTNLDYATRAGNAWNFDGPGDVTGFTGVGRSSVGGGRLSACNAPTANSTGDPSFTLSLPGGPIDADTFHRLVIDLHQNGEFNLAAGPGGGGVLRVVWTDAAGRQQVSDDIVWYPNQPTIEVDLRTSPPNLVTDDHSAAWTGKITSLRIDPNEDPAGRCWDVSRVLLLADPGANLGPRPAAGQARTPTTKAPAKKRITKKRVTRR